MGGFFPKVDEKHGDGDREYNWWGCSYNLSFPPRQFPDFCTRSCPPASAMAPHSDCTSSGIQLVVQLETREGRLGLLLTVKADEDAEGMSATPAGADLSVQALGRSHDLASAEPVKVRTRSRFFCRLSSTQQLLEANS